VGIKGIQWAIEQANKLNKPIAYVLGNHEYYHQDLSIIHEIKSMAENTRVQILDKNSYVFKNKENIRVLGCTLWTDFQLFGKCEASKSVARLSMNDFRIIQNGSKAFSPEDSVDLFNTELGWLKDKLNNPFNGKTIVVTHHAPSNQSTPPLYDENYAAIATSVCITTGLKGICSNSISLTTSFQR
jgi:hypothetical protein